MPKKCCVCGAAEYEDGLKRSYHKWPGNYDEQKLWMEQLHIKSFSSAAKQLYICSNHFSGEDLFLKQWGTGFRQYLKENTMPMRVAHDTVEITDACPRISVIDFEKDKKLIFEPGPSLDHFNADNLVRRRNEYSYLKPDAVPQEQYPPSSEPSSNSKDSDDGTRSTYPMEDQITSIEVLQPNSKLHKYCVVPRCQSTWIETPKKLFICVPLKEETRTDWLTLAGHGPKCLSTDSRMYFCEDHFDMPNDVENYLNYSDSDMEPQKMRLKPGVMPSKFDCLTDGGWEKCNCMSFVTDGERSPIPDPLVSVEQDLPMPNQLSKTQKADPFVIKTKVDDLYPSDFSTPEKRKAHVKLIRQTLNYQRTTIYKLQFAINEMRGNIGSMEKTLNKKYVMTEQL